MKVLVALGVWGIPKLIPIEPIGDVDFGRTLRLVFIVGGGGNIALGVLRFVAVRRRRQPDEHDTQ